MLQSSLRAVRQPLIVLLANLHEVTHLLRVLFCGVDGKVIIDFPGAHSGQLA